MRALMGLLSLVLSIGASALPIRVCGGDSHWPPMSYQLSTSAGVDGISVAVIKEIFKAGAEPNIVLIPWARCVYEVESHHGFDIAMSIFKTPEREKNFLFSKSYHSLTPSYLYARARYSKPPVSTQADLLHLKVCAIHGGATPYTKLPDNKIDRGAYNYPSLLKKIDQKRCDIVVDMQEIFLGLSKLGLFDLESSAYEIKPLPEVNKDFLYFAVSKAHPEAKQIINKINQGLFELSANGQMASIIRRYQQ